MIVAVAIGYLIVRIGIAPRTGLLRYHATDLLAGVALPSIIALAIPAITPLGLWARTLPGKLALIAGAIAVWEVAVPLITTRSTPDPIDALCYVAGTLLQHAAVGRK
ncbi:hypothetical protein Q5H91_06850 [Sphingomonas sp. KR1UV-12]|uniref:Uncharacterized protein n=1 Tax=Sphingomonas aurea TaxID=3063994 RepID=A0ABT9EIZ2_9SPHN|nr:hypothetical protein [Sphingomonas sp. KR1UV-12]MDP1026924.1 hypothetical protein [Sphingomonas sp. KR1UV-12]